MSESPIRVFSRAAEEGAQRISVPRRETVAARQAMLTAIVTAYRIGVKRDRCSMYGRLLSRNAAADDPEQGLIGGDQPLPVLAG